MADTPILNFVMRYAEAGAARFHMPGHKGRGILGCEKLDITEVSGADALYEAGGIIAQSEENAAGLFGAGKTLYSTEGSSQCIRAMLGLAITERRPDAAPLVVAARNVHKAFVYAAALLDFEVEWLWSEDTSSLCGCPISAEQLEQTLKNLKAKPAAVYLTSPDYLGGMADIQTLSKVCHKYDTLLIVDNAHGAYLKFLQPSLHPLDLGADMCCDSAHKTLPVLTGGAYLHIAKSAPEGLKEHAKSAMAMFGSTSPSYLTLASLDSCNAYLEGEYPAQFESTVARINRVKAELQAAGWKTEESDPLRITLRAPVGSSGIEIAERLRESGMECEYADDTFTVLMLTPENRVDDIDRLVTVLGKSPARPTVDKMLPQAKGKRALSIRNAMFAPHQLIDAEAALGRICGAPTVSCPPAIPIAVSGEVIGEEALELFHIYGVKQVDVLK